MCPNLRTLHEAAVSSRKSELGQQLSKLKLPNCGAGH